MPDYRRKRNTGGKSTGFMAVSILMLVSGIIAVFMGVIVASSRLDDGESSKLLVTIAMLLTFAYAVLEVITGIASVAGRGRVIKPSTCITLGRAVVIIAVIQLLLSAFNGITVWHLAVLGAAGIVVPWIYLIFSARGRVKRPESTVQRYINSNRY